MGIDERLVEITGERHGVAIDLVYARAGNLTGRPIYATGCCLLRREAEACLTRAVHLAGLAGLRLKLFDAYRPPAAQVRLWKSLPDPRYVADAEMGSNHSRGTAVDVTLMDLDGKELEMGTGFDAMIDLSHHHHPELPPLEQRNRLWLLGIMTQAGFKAITSEWWHYELPDARSYPVLTDDRMICKPE